MLVVTLDDPDAPPAIEQVKVNRRQVYLEELDLADLQHEHPADVGEEIRRQVAAAASAERLARFDLVGVLHHALDVDLGGLPYDDFFLLQVRDRTRTVPQAPADLPTIRAAFERRLAARLAEAEAKGESERELVQRALALGIQALEGLPL
jgi:hypothetical protein